jgi:hypothetical protein
MTTPNMSYCAMKKTGNILPMLKRGFEVMENVYLRDININCPVQPGKYYINHVEYIGEENQYKNPVNLSEVPQNGFGVHLPNGKYRFTLRSWTKDDPTAFLAQWHREIHIRLHDDNF